MKKIVLIGAGGHCKVIIDIIKSMGEYEIVGITDKRSNASVLGIPIIGNDSALSEIYNDGVKCAFVCIGALNNINNRNIIYNKLKDTGFVIPVLVHKTAIISEFSHVDKGTCVMAGAIINAGATIGENCIINTGSVIEHDCKIENNTHISPNVSIGGGVSIGFNCHIGIGSSVIHQKTIGNNVTIGAGSVVIENIADNLLAVGVPAKVIKIKK